MYGDNVYDSPEKYGLELVGSTEWSDEAYQFDMTAVFRDAEGQLYYADDSGCSCPSPFENYIGIEDLTKASRHEVLKHLANQVECTYDRDREAGRARNGAELIAKVAAL
jgi:hypothetical protein